jgi:hypothetical protein
MTSVSAAASVADDAASRGDEPHCLPRVAIAAAALGNATEWFDYGIYAYGLAYISAALFPGSTASATLFALGTFAISFLIRPLGGLFWGPPRPPAARVLALTVLTMSRHAAGRRAADLRERRLARAGRPDRAAHGAGLLDRRRIRRRGDLHRRIRARRATRPVRQLLEFATLAGFSLGALLMLALALLLGDTAMHAWGCACRSSSRRRSG